MATGIATFEWKQEELHAFQILVKKMSCLPVLAFPNTEKPLVILLDASKEVVGAALLQKLARWRYLPLKFSRCTLIRTERKFSTSEQESFFFILVLRKFRHFLQEIPFVLFSNLQALRTVLWKADLHQKRHVDLTWWQNSSLKSAIWWEVQTSLQINCQVASAWRQMNHLLQIWK